MQIGNRDKCPASMGTGRNAPQTVGDEIMAMVLFKDQDGKMFEPCAFCFINPEHDHSGLCVERLAKYSGSSLR